MALVKWEDPFAGLSTLHSQLDDMFNNFFNSATQHATVGLATMDVYSDDDKSLVAEVQVPGFDEKDIDVSVQNGMLEIRGEKKEREEEGKEGKRNYMLRESATSFYRRIALPKYADTEHIAAEFDNGMLKVTVPFKELPQPKRIQISAGKGKK